MRKHVAFQMDPMESVDINGDTTFALAEAAQARGWTMWEYGPEHLSYAQGHILARARPMTVQRDPNQPAIFGERELIDLKDDVDVVWMRQDPPFDMSYITATHILERLEGETLVVNDPKWVRNCPEKILPLDYKSLMPPTLITRDRIAIDSFRDHYKDIILKPLYGNGGAGIFRIKEEDPNYSSILEMFMESSREPIIAQAFLPDVSKGDKRILIIDGEPIGAINRVPQKGETRSNMHVGGKAVKTDLTEDDLRICRAIGPMLKERGQILVGIDVIGDKMTEINITSPTGVQELKRFSGIDAVAACWDAIEAKLS
ncbi:MAG: glutathione synthase [Litorimonas sp.]